jgi:hypothetical protein
MRPSQLIYWLHVIHTVQLIVLLFPRFLNGISETCFSHSSYTDLFLSGMELSEVTDLIPGNC